MFKVLYRQWGGHGYAYGDVAYVRGTRQWYMYKYTHSLSLPVCRQNVSPITELPYVEGSPFTLLSHYCCTVSDVLVDCCLLFKLSWELQVNWLDVVLLTSRS